MLDEVRSSGLSISKMSFASHFRILERREYPLSNIFVLIIDHNLIVSHYEKEIQFVVDDIDDCEGLTEPVYFIQNYLIRSDSDGSTILNQNECQAPPEGSDLESYPQIGTKSEIFSDEGRTHVKSPLYEDSAVLLQQRVQVDHSQQTKNPINCPENQNTQTCTRPSCVECREPDHNYYATRSYESYVLSPGDAREAVKTLRRKPSTLSSV